MRNKFINIINDANDFKYVALKCIESGEFHIGNKFYGTQFAVNGLFAIELYLKALIVLDNNEIPRQHDLTLLFDALSDSIKRDLINKLPYIIEFISSQSNGFEKWRYSYEHDCLIIGLEKIKMVLNTLELYCSDKQKELDTNE